MKKKRKDFKKLALSRETIANFDKNAVKGGTILTTFETFCGVACGETVIFTQCNGARVCRIF